MSGKIHEDNQTTFRVTVKDQDDAVVDISAATTLQIRFEQPDGTSVQKTASLTGDGTDGQMEYKAEAAFLTPGEWKYQGRVVIAGDEFTGGDSSGQPIRFQVVAKV